LFVNLFFTISLFTITSCKKSNVDAVENTNAISIAKFLTAPPNTDPAVLKVIEKIKTMQAETGFLEKFIEQNGYAYWDKAVVKTPAPSIVTSSDTTYITIPMAAEFTAIVNSLLVSKITNNNVDIKQTSESSYSLLPLEKDATSSQLSKEDFAKIFFFFSKEVFGKQDFKVNDPLMFQTDSSLAANAAAPAEEKEQIYVSLRGGNGVATGSTGVSTCTLVTTYSFGIFPSADFPFFTIRPIKNVTNNCVLNVINFDMFPLLTQVGPSLPTTGPSAPPYIPVHPWQNAAFSLNVKDANVNTENDENDNTIGGYDNTVYPSYTTGSTFSTVSNVLPVNSPSGVNYEFIRWGYTGITPYSMNYCKAQIAQKNQQISNYNDAGQTYQIYDETTGVNAAATNNAITYITGALQAGIPVIVGVDCRPGTSLGSQDNTTDHFVTIVGMGVDVGTNKNYFRYYDCSTYSLSQGTRSTNRLLYDNLTGIIRGLSPTLYANTAGFTPYKITQVRRSKPL
jgi:hypothetical protein